MPDGNLILTSVVTLLAVGLGAWLSLIGQARASSQQGWHQWWETRVGSYCRFLGAVRAYVVYVRQTPQIGADGMAYIQAVEAALAEVRLVARYDDTVVLAEALADAAERLAVATSEHGPGLVPDEHMSEFRSAQTTFVAAARRELKAGDRRPASERRPAGGRRPARYLLLGRR